MSEKCINLIHNTNPYKYFELYIHIKSDIEMVAVTILNLSGELQIPSALASKDPLPQGISYVLKQPTKGERSSK